MLTVGDAEEQRTISLCEVKCICRLIKTLMVPSRHGSHKRVWPQLWSPAPVLCLLGKRAGRSITDVQQFPPVSRLWYREMIQDIRILFRFTAEESRDLIQRYPRANPDPTTNTDISYNTKRCWP